MPFRRRRREGYRLDRRPSVAGRIVIQLLEFLVPYGVYSYFVMLGILIACGFGVPIPEDIILVTGGILAARDVTDFWVVLAVCMAGVLLGDGTVFALGRHFGPAIKAKGLFKKVMNDKNDKLVKQVFATYGDKVVFAARFMPGLRMPLFMSAGIYQVPAWKFFLFDGVAALVSVPLWIYVGYVFGANLDKLEAKVRQFQYGIYAVLLAAVLLVIGWILVKKKIRSLRAARHGGEG